MSEFLNYEQVVPAPTDELLVVRGKTAKRALVSSLPNNSSDSAIAFSQTPPTDKKLWWQLDGNGYPIDFWRKRPTGLWVGDQLYSISSFDEQIRKDSAHYLANPLADEAIWIEAITARGSVWDDMGSGEHIDFSLSLINSAQQQTKLHYLRLANGSDGQFFDLAEPVERVAAMDEALAFLLQVEPQGKPKLKTTSISLQIRRVYAES